MKPEKDIKGNQNQQQNAFTQEIEHIMLNIENNKFKNPAR
jgi:hypothetical protein